MTGAVVNAVDVLVVRRLPALEILLLRRAPTTRHPGSWESVSGSIEAGESPAEAARREVSEETGFESGTLWNLSHVESFYWHERSEVVLLPAFVWLLDDGDAAVTLSAEHDGCAWVALEAVAELASWPRLVREVAALRMMTSGATGWLLPDLRIG